ncbi:MBL fold metallo-hydrolase [Nocardia otitidiscaviarum]|uniref:MBL fold metallo-hydrolase n=1 Tax=Nocardia otitidiscaviarum TaxID=1823 RepID=UPI0006948F42|nr:MBL fold metallo-hydrolase [Nocardia otitidiscaviarum]MBF6135032.1 MBL fold metallo-hydrolase [Nocardia otitidiscaviarum]
MTVHVLDAATLRPARGHEIPTQVLLVERSGGLLAVDAGLSVSLLLDQSGLSFERHFIRPPRRASLALANQVRALGYDPRDVTDIALTHLHSEHAGGIMDFPRARIHVSRREYDIATGPSIRSRISYRRTIWAHGPRWELHTGNTPWRGVPEVARIDADTVLVPLPGHTLGHCGVGVRTGEGWILHAGDATYGDPADAGVVPEFPLRQYQWFAAADRGLQRDTDARLRRLAQQPDVRIICSHNRVGDLPMPISVPRGGTAS